MLSNPPVILVVEDDKLIQDLIERWLSSIGAEIHFASNGLEGVRKYEGLCKAGRKPDVVVMDIGMPIMDGVEATREIMRIDPGAKIFGFTAFYGTEKAKQLLNAGAIDIIPRSVGFETFARIIKEVLMQDTVIR